MSQPNRALGLACATVIIFIWSGFIVFSRAGVTGGLTAHDLTALRFIVAGVITLPFVWTWWPRHLPRRAVLMLSLCGPGAIYSVLMFSGLENATAAYGGVFANGSLPLFTMLLVLLVSGVAPGRRQILAVGIIALGGVAVGWRGMTGGDDVLAGIGLFLIASAVLSIYIHGVGHWGITPRQALALINVPNAILFLPVWYFLLPSTISTAPVEIIVLHGLFQGLGPGFLAVILFALAATHLGPTPTAGFSASVPASAALLAIPVLGEVPGPLEWTGIAIVTLGLVLLIARR